uniref:Sec23/Sec24 helical domain-containing protein n=1 Tax=Anopheles maculatus TaxID=74869 RepID=A0A182SZX4_9DIPT
MKLLPLYVNCLLKNDAFSGGSDISIDDRSYVIYYVMTMDLPTSVHYFYPRLIPLHDCTQQIDTDRTGLPVFDNPLSKRVRGIVEKIQDQKRRCMRLTLVKQRDKLESVLRHFLVEDRGTSDGSVSYVDFLCHVHKEIRQMLS